jgi:hypothetical protein
VNTSQKESIPPSRITLYAIIGSFLPVMAALLWTQSTIATAQSHRYALHDLGEKIQKKAANQERNRLIIQKFRGKDPLFLHHHIESIRPLSKEIAFLQEKVQKIALPEDGLYEKRLATLVSGENNFSFTEASTELGGHYKETVENQTKPVDLDSSDLQTVLTLLEGNDSDSEKPHLIISEAHIERKKALVNEVWSVLFKIIRRDYTE